MSDSRPESTEDDYRTVAMFWIQVWCGIVAGGATFGAMLLRSDYFGRGGPVVGAALGAVFAGAFGVAVTYACASTARAIGTPRSRLLAAIAGLGTGAIFSIALHDGSFTGLRQYLAALVVAAGATIAAWNYHPPRQPRPRITIAYLLVHTACLAVLVAAWQLLSG